MPCGFAVFGEDGVVAEMRIAVDHGRVAEGMPPGLEHRDREPVADLLIGASDEGQDLLAVEPAEREEPPRREVADATPARALRAMPASASAVERARASPRAGSRAPRGPARRSRSAISRVSIAGSRRRCSAKRDLELAAGPPRRPTACRDIAACRRAAPRPSASARCTCPREAAAAGLRSKEPNRACQSGPSSACIRRLTKAAPIGGASLCSFWSSAAYSGGIRSGIVARSCATFMIGPLSPPSACASAAAFEASCPSPRREAACRPSAPRPRRHWRRRGHSAPRGRRSGSLRDRLSVIGDLCKEAGFDDRLSAQRQGGARRRRPLASAIRHPEGGIFVPNRIEKLFAG